MNTATIPKAVEQAGPGKLRILWQDGHDSVYPVRLLRLACRCANCIEEMTGEPRLIPETVPLDVQPTQIKSVGRYALGFAFTDGHDTGIYTFEHLRNLCPCCQ